jgi:carboxymethylenebutenolidase
MLERIEIGGEGAGGFLARPPAPALAAGAPAVVLLPAIAGVNDYIRRVSLRLVERGYAVLALDYFARRGGPPDLSSPEKIMAAVGSVPDEQVVADVGAAIARMGDEPGIDGQRVAALGVCMGGSMAILANAKTPGLACTIAFYGLLRYQRLTETKPLAPLDAAADLRVPLLGHWGDTDHLVPTADVEELRERLRGKQAEIYRYPGAGHAFHEDFRDVYRPVAAAEAWQRSLRYLDWYLRGVAA